MRLISCTIENFGKLNNISYDFTRGCNVICEDNGWGKSTLAAFIRVMFYGFKNEGKKKLSEKERNRMQPWQKGVYGGEVSFEADGVEYSVRRVFGHKQTDDEFSLIRKDTNMECNDYSSNLGEELFRIDSESFERTVFIAQSDCTTYTTDSINAKIGNLADNTDDINNFETVIDKFKNMLNSMSETRATGSMAKRKSQITGLKSQINNYSDVEKTIKEQIAIRDGFCEKLDILKNDRKELEKKQKNLSKKKDVQAKKDKYDALVNACRDKEKTYTDSRRFFKDEIPDRDEIRYYIRECDDAGRIMGKIAAPDEQNRALVKKYEQMFSQGIPDENVFSRLEEDLKRLIELKHDEDTNRLSVEEQQKYDLLKNRYKDAIPDDTDIVRLQEQLAECDKRSNSLAGKEMTLDLAKQTEKSHKDIAGEYRDSMLPVIVSGVILAIIAAALIMINKFAGIVLLAVGVAVVIAAVIISCNRKKKYNEKYTAITNESSEKIRQIEKQIEDDRHFIEETRRDVALFCEKYKTGYEGISPVLQLSDIRQDVRAYRELDKRVQLLNNDGKRDEISRLVENLKHMFLKYGLNADDNYELYLEKLKNSVSDYRRLMNISESNAKYEREYNEKISGIAEYVKLYVSDSEERADLNESLREMDKKLDEYEKSKNEYAAVLKEKSDYEESAEFKTIMNTDVEDECVNQSYSLEDIAEKLTRITEESENIANNIRASNRNIEMMQEQLEELDNCKEELTGLEQAQAQEKRKAALIKKTKEIMEESKQSFTAKYMEPVMSGFKKYFNVITDNSADEYRIDADTNLTVIEQNLPRNIDSLSAGRQDLVGICLRMALVNAMYKEEKPFLIFDDPFVNLDDNNIKGGMKLLDEIAKDYQVIYFTCSESRKK